MFRKFLILFSFIFASINLFAEGQVVVINNVSDSIFSINPHASFFIDSSAQKNLCSIKDSKSLFEPMAQFDAMNAPRVVWVNFCITNRTENSRLVLNLADWKSGDSIKVFLLQNDSLIHESLSGYFIKANELDYSFNNAISKTSLVIPKGDTLEVFVRYITLSGFGSIPDLSVEHEPVLLTNDRNEGLIHGIFQGLIWLIALFSISFFIFLRERIYLYYTLYIAIFSAYFMGQDGFLFEIILPGHPYLANLIYAASSILSPTFFLLFTRRLILNKRKLHFWVRGHKILITIYFFVALLVIILLIFNQIKVAFVLVNFTVLSSSIYMIPFIIRLTGIKDNDVFYVFLASLTMLVFSVWGVISLQFNIRFGNFSAYELMKIGVTLELTFFNLAIANRIYKNEKDKIKTREKLIEQLKINQAIKDKMNEELEDLVKMRTQELENQKAEIQAQRDDIYEKNRLLEDKNHEILAQKETIESNHKMLTDSLHYARIIQNAILPSTENIQELFPEYFLLSRPKDVVSGDFFWVKHMGGKSMVAVADCTGHGVPGAMLSVLGVTSLDKITRDMPQTVPNETLEMLRMDIVETLHQEHDLVAKEGLDMALCMIDPNNDTLIFSGAHQPGIIIRDGQIIKMEPAKQPIGRYIKEVPFQNQFIELFDGDMIYLYTDGFFDQLGGEQKKKLLSRRFKNKLLAIYQLPCNEQSALLQEMLEDWKGAVEQTDDITVLGIRYKK